MFREIFQQAWYSLRRNPLRSILTILGIAWGIVAVTLLLAYGSEFRGILVRAFEAVGKSSVICWPGQTSEQAGGQRAGKNIRFETVDRELVLQQASFVRNVSLETVRWLPITYGDRLDNTAIRGVYPEYSEIRNEVASEGRWLSPEDFLERRRVVFLGQLLCRKLFAGRPAVGETVLIRGVRFTVVGLMNRKIQFSNYFTSDDESAFIPYTTAGDLWNTRYASVMVFSALAPGLEAHAMRQVRAAIAQRQQFSPTDERAVTMFGREQFRPVIDGITIGLQVLLAFIGMLTLGIGGVGLMNIMLVSVDERIREIGIRRALGATRRQIKMQFLFEALLITVVGGLLGMALAYPLAGGVGVLPLLGPLFRDTSGQADIHLHLSFATMAVSSSVLILVGVLSGLVPAIRASRLDPSEALRYE